MDGTSWPRVPENCGVTFEPQPVLHGRSLTLRPLRGVDFDALYAVARDPLLWEQHPVSDRHSRAVFEEFFADALESGGALVVVARDGPVIGSSRFHGYDEQRSEVEVGWTFPSRSHWGGTTNLELKQLMLGHALRSVKRVVFLVGPENYRSQRAMEKIGARRAGTRLDGAGQENVLFEFGRKDLPSLMAGGSASR